jgi:hypothetical protein
MSKGLLGFPWYELFWEPLRQLSRQIEDIQPSDVQALSIIKAGSMSSPKEAELRTPLPGNDANLLSLQETLCGCRPEVLGNLRNECFCVL